MGRAAQVGRNEVEKVSTSGKLSKLVIYCIRTESSEWMTAVLCLEKPPTNEKAIWSRRPDQKKKIINYDFFKINPIHSTASLSDLVLCTQFFLAVLT